MNITIKLCPLFTVAGLLTLSGSKSRAPTEQIVGGRK